jgi:hypothetical protein
MDDMPGPEGADEGPEGAAVIEVEPGKVGAGPT